MSDGFDSPSGRQLANLRFLGAEDLAVLFLSLEILAAYAQLLIHGLLIFLSLLIGDSFEFVSPFLEHTKLCLLFSAAPPCFLFQTEILDGLAPLMMQSFADPLLPSRLIAGWYGSF